MKKETTGKAQTNTQATQGKADSKRKGVVKVEVIADSTAQPTAQAGDNKPAGDSKADKPAGRAEAEAAALAMAGKVKSHTGGRINLDSVRICPRKGGKVKAFLRPTYIVPDGVTLTPYEAGGFTGFIVCDLNTDDGRQTLAALIAAKHKPTAADKKAASKAEAGKATGKGNKGKATGQQASKGKGTGKGQAGKASKPTAGKGQAGKATA